MVHVFEEEQVLQFDSHAWQLRPVAAEPLPTYPLGQLCTQLSSWRYLEFLHTVHVFEEEQVLQFDSHAWQLRPVAAEPLPKYPLGQLCTQLSL